MAKKITLDFLRGYQLGTRRESDPVAYQYDEGHTLEVKVPTSVTTAEIQYWIRGMDKAEAYTPGEITAEEDGTYTITGNVPNSFFEHSGDLRVYVVVTDNDASVVTYEGYVHIVDRQMPEDYVDDDPENEAARVLEAAREAAATATAAAETCQEVAESIPEDYSALSQDVTDLKADLSDIVNLETSISGDDITGWVSGKNVIGTDGSIGTSNTFSACETFIRLPDYVPTVIYKTTTYSSFVGTYSKPDVSGFIERLSASANGTIALDTSVVKYIRISVNSLDTLDAETVSWSWECPVVSKLSKALSDINYIADYKGNTTGEDYSPWESSKTLTTEGKIGSSDYYSACQTFIRVPEFVDTIRVTTGANYGALVCTYSEANENSFVERFTYTANHGYDLDVSVNKYIRIAIQSTDVADVGTVSFKYRYPLKDTIDNISALLGTTASSLLKAITTDYSTVTNIQNNTDYDTLTTPGNFYVGSSAAAQTMSHCPVNVAHRLIVFTTTSANRLWQIVIPNANTDVYMRTNMGSWNGWNKLITTRNGIESYDTRITSANYESILPDLNLAKENTIYSIATNVPIANMPEGNLNVAGADQTYGIPSGTLITLRGDNFSGGYERFQLFMNAAGLPEGGVGSILTFRGCRYTNGAYSWDKWSKVGNGVNLRATNTFIQESRIQAGTAMFSDMNDAPNNTIVQIDLDAVSMANNPMTGHSCVLITLCPSYISRHGMLQLCSGITGGSALLFFRYGYQQAPGEIVWMPWKQTMTVGDGAPLLNKGRLANNTDFNTILDNSIYLLGTNAGYEHDPLSGYTGFLTTKAVNDVIMQTAERLNGERHTRYSTDGGTNWSSWTA